MIWNPVVSDGNVASPALIVDLGVHGVWIFWVYKGMSGLLSHTMDAPLYVGCPVTAAVLALTEEKKHKYLPAVKACHMLPFPLCCFC